jgi:DmsE family decaheme c-type cytochrome
MRRTTLIAGAVLGAALAARGAADTAACGDCHEQAPAFAMNVHAHRPGGPSGDAACVSCHGDGAKHVEAGGGKETIRVVRGASGSELCLSCHAKVDAHASYRGGIHRRGEVANCLTCHSIHGADRRERALLAEPPDALCARCHEPQSASFRAKPFGHRLGCGGMSCVSCHEPHRLASAGTTKSTRGAEAPCLSCHAEKRGPFVFPHVTNVAGDCLACHEPHGSSNPKRLKRASVQQLCIECHSPITPGLLGSQPPAFHDLRSPRYRECTVCHTAVHGSNRAPNLLK